MKQIKNNANSIYDDMLYFIRLQDSFTKFSCDWMPRNVQGYRKTSLLKVQSWLPNDNVLP